MSYGVVLYEGRFMVKAVVSEDATKLSSADSISIENPEDDVEFKIDFEEDKTLSIKLLNQLINSICNPITYLIGFIKCIIVDIFCNYSII